MTNRATKSVLAEYSVNPPDVYGFGHRSYYEHVVECLTDNRAHLIDGLEGRRSLELITAIYESIESGEEVRGLIPATPLPAGATQWLIHGPPRSGSATS